MTLSRIFFYKHNAYRYGFNGKENDNDVKGEGNQQDYGMRIYDPRLGRFLSVDPITKQYPELTPYQFASNTPIQAVDIDGLEKEYYIFKDGFLPTKLIIARDGQLQKRLYGADAMALAENDHPGSVGGHKRSIESIGAMGTAITTIGTITRIPQVIAVGEVLNFTATGLTALDEYSHGKTGDALLTVGTSLITGYVGNKVGKLVEASKPLTVLDKPIIMTATLGVGKVAENVVDKVFKTKDTPVSYSLPLIPDFKPLTPVPFSNPSPTSKPQPELKPKK
jgi:RHS repeat-associated protein